MLVLLAVADYAYDDGTNAWPSVKLLAEKSRMTERAVRFILARLEADGELIVRENVDAVETVDGFAPKRFMDLRCCGKDFPKREKISQKGKMLPRKETTRKTEKSGIRLKEDPSGDPLFDLQVAVRFDSEALLAIWNQYRGKMPECSWIGGARMSHARARLKEQPDRTVWVQVVEMLAASAFATGTNDRGWVADFDFLIKAGTWRKVLEGKYADRRKTPGAGQTVDAAGMRRRTREANVAHVTAGGINLLDGKGE